MPGLPPNNKTIYLYLALAVFLGYAFTFGFTTTTIFPLLTGIVLAIAFYFIAKSMKE